MDILTGQTTFDRNKDDLKATIRKGSLKIIQDNTAWRQVV